MHCGEVILLTGLALSWCMALQFRGRKNERASKGAGSSVHGVREREGVIWQTCQAGLWQPSAVTFHYRSYWIQLPHKPGEMTGRKDAAVHFCKVRSLRRSAVTAADVWCDRMTEWHLGDFTSTSLVFVDEKISNAWRHTVVLVVWAQKSQMGE